MMAQWHSCKEQIQDALLLFRLGDFYEAFHDDAQVISKEIGLTLTARQSIPMCGIPVHAAESYIDRLIAKGFKIAIAEQEGAEGKGLMRREVARFVTPATLIQSQLLREKVPNFFASLAQIGSVYGLILFDLTTLELRALEWERLEECADELCRVRPPELLLSRKFQTAHDTLLRELSHRFPFLMTVIETVEPFPLEVALQKRLSGQVAALAAAEALFRHLRVQLKIEIPPLSAIPQALPAMAIDRSTLHHLELVESLSPKSSLLHQIDSTETPMGGRLLRDWLQHPLLSLPAISARQDAVETLLTRNLPLEGIRDLERLIGKISSSYATPRDLLALGLSLTRLPPLRSVAVNSPSPLIRSCAQEIGDLTAVTHKILVSLVESPPMRIGDGEIFRDGIHAELDRLRTLAKDSLQWMANYQTTLRDQTGIKTLKVSFTRAFGYYIEVTLAQRDRVPATFQRRQTLTSGERFTTDELKRFEAQILTAEEKSRALEAELFEALRREVALSAPLIRQSARAIAQLDALASLASAVRRHRWVRPQVEESSVLEIHQGRHPVLESLLGSAHFIPNDTLLTPPQSQLMLITGPNMAGKSTYLRQVALIVILAQIGSFVPAQSARVGLIDKIFSRIGASDDLARGQSTFMVEMSETAQILANATSRSLVLLDEVGRGTSTYDGIAIAWSVAEYLLSTPDRRAKTLFATHYSELTQLEAMWEGAINYQVAVEETDSGVAFLRTIVPGAARKSYGIHVAKLAGLPPKAIQRAQELLTQLEKNKPHRTKKEAFQPSQISLF